MNVWADWHYYTSASDVYFRFVEDAAGDLVDVKFWCSMCRPNDAVPYSSTVFSRPDYAVHCERCAAQLMEEAGS